MHGKTTRVLAYSRSQTSTAIAAGQINNSASYKIHDSSKCRQTYLSRNTSHRGYMVQRCAFCKLKSSTRNDSAYMEGNIYFLFRSPLVRFPLTSTRWRSHSFVFIYRLNCCSRDKMPATRKQYEMVVRGRSFNGRIKLNATDAESKNRKA